MTQKISARRSDGAAREESVIPSDAGVPSRDDVARLASRFGKGPEPRGGEDLIKVFLLPETVTHEEGVGAEFALGSERGKPLLLTLGITQIVEEASLDISIWGSVDQEHWRQLISYPQKAYCGTYLLMLDLSHHSEVCWLRAQWRLSRWGAGEPAVFAGFHLSVQEVKARMGATA